MNATLFCPPIVAKKENSGLAAETNGRWNGASSHCRVRGAGRSRRGPSVRGMDVATLGSCSSSLLARPRSVRGRATSRHRRRGCTRRTCPCPGSRNHLICRRGTRVGPHGHDPGRRLRGFADPSRRAVGCQGRLRVRGVCDRYGGHERRARVASALRASRNQGVERSRRLHRSGGPFATACCGSPSGNRHRDSGTGSRGDTGDRSRAGGHPGSHASRPRRRASRRRGRTPRGRVCGGCSCDRLCGDSSLGGFGQGRIARALQRKS